jgi:hypothetical protein
VRQSPRLSGSSDQGNPGSARSLQHSGHHGRVLPRAPGHAASGIGDGRSALRPVTVNKCVRGPRTVGVVLSCPTFTLQNQRKKRADERTRTAHLLQLRVIIHALQGVAQACKSRISKPFSFPRLAACCTVLRSRWCQSGVNWYPADDSQLMILNTPIHPLEDLRFGFAVAGSPDPRRQAPGCDDGATGGE